MIIKRIFLSIEIEVREGTFEVNHKYEVETYNEDGRILNTENKNTRELIEKILKENGEL